MGPGVFPCFLVEGYEGLVGGEGGAGGVGGVVDGDAGAGGVDVGLGLGEVGEGVRGDHVEEDDGGLSTVFREESL